MSSNVRATDVTGIAREVRVSDREHAAIQPVQATGAHPSVDRAHPEAGSPQLLVVHDAVLRRRDLGDSRVRARRVANLHHMNM